MSGYNKNKACSNFKSLENDIFTKYQSRSTAPNCRVCVYFSSRNCGMDASNSIDPAVDFLI
ncbi:MAG: hypothetical protein LBV08_04050 [Clostridiales bacterium]|nr:hypothetical protein [Clostridiales bacterium]